MVDGENTRVAVRRPDLEGWKQIADVLGVSVKTAHRYEAAGMPVMNWGPRLVVAYREEILAWMLRHRGARRAAA